MLRGVIMTDEEQKQIETMAIVMCENFELRMKNQTCTKCRTYNKNCYAIHKAELLHSAGYRQADEVRNEIAKEILNALGSTSVGGLVMKLKNYPQFKEICEKYQVEVE